MATNWRTGMKLTKARLDAGSSIAWTNGWPIRAEQLRNGNNADVTAGDALTPERMNAT